MTTSALTVINSSSMIRNGTRGQQVIYNDGSSAFIPGATQPIVAGTTASKLINAQAISGAGSYAVPAAQKTTATPIAPTKAPTAAAPVAPASQAVQPKVFNGVTYYPAIGPDGTQGWVQDTNPNMTGYTSANNLNNLYQGYKNSVAQQVSTSVPESAWVPAGQFQSGSVVPTMHNGQQMVQTANPYAAGYVSAGGLKEAQQVAAQETANKAASKAAEGNLGQGFQNAIAKVVDPLAPYLPYITMAALLAIGISDPGLLSSAEAGTLTTEELASTGIDPTVLADTIESNPSILNASAEIPTVPEAPIVPETPVTTVSAPAAPVNPVEPTPPTNLVSTGISDSAPGTIYTGPDGVQEIVLNNGQTVNLAEYQAAQASGQPISVNGQMTTGGSASVEVTGSSYTAETGVPSNVQLPENMQLATQDQIANAKWSDAAGTYTDPATGVVYDQATSSWIIPKEIVVTATKLGITPAEVVALGGATAAAVALGGGAGGSGGAAAGSGATPSTTTTPSVTEPVAPTTPPTTTPPTTTPPPVTEPPLSPVQPAPPVVNPPVTPVETGGAPVHDYSTPYNGPYRDATVLGAALGSMSWGDIAALVAAGYLLPGVLAGLNPQQPTDGGYGPIGPTIWGTAKDVVNPGLNPGYMGIAAKQPFYHDTTPNQAQYYWGQHPFASTIGDLANYNNVPTAPTTPWGAATSAVGGTQHMDVNQFIQRNIGTPYAQAATTGSSALYPAVPVGQTAYQGSSPTPSLPVDAFGNPMPVAPVAPQLAV